MPIFDNLLRKVLHTARKEVLNRFIRYIEPMNDDTVLDLGGGMHPGNPCFEDFYPFKERIICANIDIYELNYLKKHYHIPLVLADGCHLPFKSKAIEIVFSNAVIEHIGDYKRQKKFACEIRRVAINWFVSTPNFWFPFEPHWKLPFIHFLPEKIQKQLVNSRKKRFIEARSGLPRIHLLSERRLRKLFPTSKIKKQRTPFYPEVLIAYSTARAHPLLKAAKRAH